MDYTTLVSATELATHLREPNWAVIDCRFDLADTGKGLRDYLDSHIPGAVYAHLDADLSGPVILGSTGRHPLPDIQLFADKLSSWGVSSRSQVVAYDNAGGAMAAARLWWMLRWLGHDRAAVLDGGWSAWRDDKRPVTSGRHTREHCEFVANPKPELVASTLDVESIVGDPSYCLIDARSSDSFSGKHRGYDPIGGHILGAKNAPRGENLDSSKRFLPRADLRRRFEDILQGVPPERTVFYCGSGVTAAHNVLALTYAGLGPTRLYPGSWSEWILDSKHPIATLSD
jgi:thiosulfate/3-mercaptopyruvate sulfurtransferase